MNWGYKILAVYIVFVIGILLLVLKTSTEKNDLVTTDYYAKELMYQQKIDESKRTNDLSAAPVIQFNGTRLQVHFPKEFAQKKLHGDILLYCPADEKRDVQQKFDVDDTELLMTLPPTKSGMYEMQISWEAAGVKYYFTQKIFI